MRSTQAHTPPPSLLDTHTHTHTRTHRHIHYTNTYTKQTLPSVLSFLQLEARQQSERWSEAERKVFMDLFLQHPKEFRTISSALPGNRSQGDCVAFFYKHQKLDEWANVRRKQQLKKRKVGGMRWWCASVWHCRIWRWRVFRFL